MSAEKIYKKKSNENFSLAQSARKTHPNASASRIYYALFLGAVSEFERIGIQPQKIDRGSADAFVDRGVKWTHSFVKNNARMIGLDPDQCRIMRLALMLRVVGDYMPEDVDGLQLDQVFRKATDILECLGVVS